MPKMKTHSGAKKRFKKTAKGKLRARHSFTSHNLGKKDAKRKRRLGRPVEVAKADEQARPGAPPQVSRVKRSVHARKKRRATLDRTKGYRGQAKSSYKRAKEALLKADSYSYAHRRTRKRDFRRLWITRINAAARQEGMSYSQFMHGLTPGRRGARPQGAGRHGRARPRDLPTFCRDRPGGGCCLTQGGAAESLPGRPARRPFSFHDPKST